MTSVRRPFNKSRGAALKKARKEFKGPIEKAADKYAVKLLDKARDFNEDWSTNTRGRPVKAPVTESHQRSAALLHQRGEKLSEADSCSRCSSNKGVWQSEIVRRGGLLAVIKQEELERVQRERERQREREAESEALSRNGRRTEVSVVVHSPPRATKQSSCVKIEGRTLRGSNKLLKEKDLKRVRASIIKTKNLLWGLRARKDVLKRRLRLRDNSRVKNEDDSSGSSDSLSDSDVSVSSVSSNSSHDSDASEALDNCDSSGEGYESDE
ncbi:hypothetical protein IFM61606_09641 [Aspergillus udagawae]|uniref:Uncharacterized protein n=1 Tax=Aspergillus udagawae TaxID=91492 RepID=A0ABQ1AJN8_9EURO|nr:hypothetical protein IFM61606_09641 [Aspergillus udagawae]GFF46566.1 hypothetical protein IFM51744_06353 [Aspergillus udagawae]GFF83120.1 hypothetical protein IFM53868_03701 [Aspergillus udagawae]GFG05128.1 hypothetical protein IFM5058_02272 [Aspergillus udagawae]